MYCVKCGVKLAPGETVCPLCQTVVYHPELGNNAGTRQYPSVRPDAPVISPWGSQFLLTMLSLLPIIITPLCDLSVHDRLTWSPYAMLGTLLFYVLFIFPYWFQNKNPVIFIPCDCAAIGLYLLFIDLYTGPPHWFLRFAFPLLLSGALIISAAITLRRYVKGGRLYVYGGVCIAFAVWVLMSEFLIVWNFPIPYYGWGIYPCIVFTLLGLSLILIAIVRPLRESLEKRFFIEPPTYQRGDSQ